MSTTTVLAPEEWRARAAAHHRLVDELTAGHRERRSTGRSHPVEDFLWVYYQHTPARLRRWHPGVGVRLEGAERDWSFYDSAGGTTGLDLDRFREKRGRAVEFVHRLLTATLERAPTLGCFGMHEWAMVYQLGPDDVRHEAWPLRLGADGTDTVVESMPVRCSHFDAYRFFTPDAAPLNSLRPTRETQVEMEQPGCLHAGMDCYKWAFKLTPAVPSELVTDCFVHARETRRLDMEASPYDLGELGIQPVRVETPEGRAEYVRRQRELADRSQTLRRRLVEVCEQVLAY